jgi:hypothetical protein
MLLRHTAGTRLFDPALLAGHLAFCARVAAVCLVKAFALRWMLAQHGIPVQLRIGANKASEGIHPHTWVEIDGQPIGESEDITERFKVLDSVGREIP